MTDGVRHCPRCGFLVSGDTCPQCSLYLRASPKKRRDRIVHLAGPSLYHCRSCGRGLPTINDKRLHESDCTNGDFLSSKKRVKKP